MTLDPSRDGFEAGREAAAAWCEELAARIEAAHGMKSEKAKAKLQPYNEGRIDALIFAAKSIREIDK